jgi:hypothetical protein
MFEMKPILPETIPEALERAERYRLLGEPDDASSICLDILAIEPDNQDALVSLLLALTDTFSAGDIGPAFENATGIVEKLDSSRRKNYYLGIIYERRAKCILRKGSPGAAEASYGWFIKAMEAFEKDIEDGDRKNTWAELRWNSCARLLNNNPEIKAEAGGSEMLLDTFETPH